jgi:branched-chain amino acid transport system permease protein
VIGQQLVNGVVLGCIYALLALGFSMVFGILRLINFAHGEVFMVGAMVSITVLNLLLAYAGHPVPLALAGLLLLVTMLAAALSCGLLGIVLERVAYRPLRRAPVLAPLISAIAASIFLQNVAMLVWGRQYIGFPDILPKGGLQVGEAVVSWPGILIVIVAPLLMLGLNQFMKRTRIGKSMRATAEDLEVAGYMGIDTDRVIVSVFFVGSVLAGIAGTLVSLYLGVTNYFIGFFAIMKAFAAAVLGGVGSLTGAVLGGLLLGLIESFATGYLPDLTGGIMGTQYKDIFAFLVLVVFLIVRPSGLLGERASERA